MSYRIEDGKMQIAISLKFEEAIELLPVDKITPYLYFSQIVADELTEIYINESLTTNRPEIISKIQAIADYLKTGNVEKFSTLEAIANGTYVIEGI